MGFPLADTAPGGKLNTISQAVRTANSSGNVLCQISIPATNSDGDAQNYIVEPRILPEITDQKSASYADTTVIGRSTPIKTYSSSDNRTLSIKLHYLVVEEADIENNYRDIWAIASAAYPRTGEPYKPPPVCEIQCGKMLGEVPLCCILQNYSIQFPNNVVWDAATLVPYYFNITTSWHVVYSTGGEGLPNQTRILFNGV